MAQKQLSVAQLSAAYQKLSCGAVQIYKWVINDSILPQADPRGEQAVLVLMVAQTDLVFLHLSYDKIN